jgi:hypothetical protein
MVWRPGEWTEQESHFCRLVPKKVGGGHLQKLSWMDGWMDGWMEGQMLARLLRQCCEVDWRMAFYGHIGYAGQTWMRW